VWSVEYEHFGDFAAVEEFQDPKQFLELVEGTSAMHTTSVEVIVFIQQLSFSFIL
jgi:hypothetical protein